MCLLVWTKSADGLIENPVLFSDSRWRVWNGKNEAVFTVTSVHKAAALIYVTLSDKNKNAIETLLKTVSSLQRYIHIKNTRATF